MPEKYLFGSNELVLKKPFLRWTGGKNWLIPHFSKIISKIEFNNYHEPFLGGGSIYFSLNSQKKAYLSDYNFDLINTYIQVRDNPSKLFKHLKSFPQNKEFYYKLRGLNCRSDIKNAAKFIYLNKTSFNGIYRVNKKGEFNVPYGRKSMDLNFVEELIYSCSTQLKNTLLASMDFEESLKKVKKNDLVFLDPPYTISHNNNGFVKYNEKLFSVVDQLRLAGFIKELREKGAYYILSNAHHPDVKKIYNKFNDKALSLTRRSLIAAKASARDLYKEYVFTNINL